MSSFTFGTQGTTISTTPVTGNLFGAVSKPLFGSSATTTLTAGTGLFGAPTSLPTASTTPAGGLIGTTGIATTSTVCVPFGNTSVTTAPGFFGVTPAATSVGNLFGKPTGLFSNPATVTTALTGGLFGGSGALTTTTGVGLGGTGTLASTGLVSSSLGAAGAAASGNPLETEVQQVVMDLFNLLRDQIKKNHELSVEFSMNSLESCLNVDEKIEELVGTRVKNADIIRKAKDRAEDVREPSLIAQKVLELLEKMQRDLRVAEQVRRRQKEISKNPHFGRKQAFSYLLTVCNEHENTVREFWETLQLLQERIDAKLNKKSMILSYLFSFLTLYKSKSIKAEYWKYNSIPKRGAHAELVVEKVLEALKFLQKDMITKQDLQKHFEHYDQTFKVICSDVYRYKTQIEDLKDVFLEYQKRTNPYAPNLFEQRKSKHAEKPNAERRLMGADAFPSQITMMKIGEMAKPSSTTQQTTGISGFGTPGSLFGSKTFGTPAFSFNPSATNTTAPLFKPFSTTSSASAPLFGTLATSVAESVSAPTTTSSFTFGNTLNSSVSGTLFGGSASKPFGR
uniref:Nucleoporin p58/p45 n=1 Tax=Elaeophora elaphi TaxID=1147741 RepID=A0A0R3RQV7_9BILA